MLSSEVLHPSTESLLAERLTCLPPDFAGAVRHEFSAEMFYPVGNDRRLGDAYNKFAQKLPKPDAGKTGVILMVGNGSFETASQLLPEDTLTLHCDKNPRTLFMLRAIRELIRRNDSVDEFLSDAHDLDTELNWHMFNRDFLGQAYKEHAYKWNHSEASHFLQDDEAFTSAKAALKDRQIGYYCLNLGESKDVEQLGKRLAETDCQAIGANVTNVFEHRYTSVDAAAEFTTAVPFHPEAPIIWSADGNRKGLTATVSPAKTWLHSLSAPGYC